MFMANDSSFKKPVGYCLPGASASMKKANPAIFDRRNLRVDLVPGLANWAIFLDHIPTMRSRGRPHEITASTTPAYVFVSSYCAAFVYAPRMSAQSRRRSGLESSGLPVGRLVIQPVYLEVPIGAWSPWVTSGECMSLRIHGERSPVSVDYVLSRLRKL